MSSTPWKSDDHFVSLYDFLPEVRKKMKLPRKIQVHDVTLRDGEQQARITFRKDEKVKIAKALDEAGVDRIEAGMPSVSAADAEALKEIVHLGLSAKVYAFSRCMKPDVDLALKLDVDGIIMEVPSSDHFLKYSYGWPEDKAVNLAVEATSYAHEHGLPVTFFTIDSTRATLPVISRLVGKVAKEGHMDGLALADTVGVLNPEATTYFVRQMKKLAKKPIEIHAHNDFGLGVANTIAAVLGGAEVVHVTVNGLGERTGNTPLEDTVMALHYLYGVKTNVKRQQLRPLSKLVSELAQVKVPPQKSVVGDDIFTIESGLVVGFYRRVTAANRLVEIFPYTPETVGHDAVKILIGKKSGRDSIAYMAEKLKLNIPESQVDELLRRMKETAVANKRPLTEEEFGQLVQETAPREILNK